MKKQKPTQGALKRLLALYNGEELTLSETQTRLFDKMKREGVIVPASQHGSRTTYKTVGLERLKQYLSEELSIQDLQSFHDFIFAESNKQHKTETPEMQGEQRSLKPSPMEGFLVTSVEPIRAQVGGRHFTIDPPQGIYLYIYEYFKDLPAVIEYLKGNGIITSEIHPTKEAITAVLSQIQNSRPNDISWMLEEFVIVDD